MTFKKILITGASSGIGAALATTYARPGVHLVLTARNMTRLEDVAAACQRAGATVTCHAIDVREAERMAERLLTDDTDAPFDLVIANAGISGGTLGTGVAESSDQVRTIFDVNVQGVLNTIQPLIPRMAARGYGHVALMGSLAGFAPWPGAPAYAASKAAIKTYALALRMALEPSGVAVSVICPGFVETPMTEINPYPMPFLMKGDKAASLIVQGLKKNRAIIAFPWPMALAARTVGVLPFFLQRLILRGAPGKPALQDAGKSSL